LLQVSATFFTFWTINCCWPVLLPEPAADPPDAGALLDPLVLLALLELWSPLAVLLAEPAGEGVPFTLTCCPTMLLNFELSPAREYFVPELSVRTYPPFMPVSWLTQPSIVCALPELLLPWSLDDCVDVALGSGVVDCGVPAGAVWPGIASGRCCAGVCCWLESDGNVGGVDAGGACCAATNMLAPRTNADTNTGFFIVSVLLRGRTTLSDALD
jgi:hypothetical protein